MVSVKSGLVLGSISQTGGSIFRPLSQVATETVQVAVQELEAKFVMHESRTFYEEDHLHLADRHLCSVLPG